MLLNFAGLHLLGEEIICLRLVERRCLPSSPCRSGPAVDPAALSSPQLDAPPMPWFEELGWRVSKLAMLRAIALPELPLQQ